jgi:hypothetical protein
MVLSSPEEMQEANSTLATSLEQVQRANESITTSLEEMQQFKSKNERIFMGLAEFG